MKYKVQKILRGFRPLVIEDGTLFLFKNGNIYEMDLDGSKPTYICQVPNFCASLIKKLASSLRILNRIFRFQPTASIFFVNHIYLEIKSKIYKFNLSTKVYSVDFIIPWGRKVLNFSVLNEAAEKILVFGEYFSNPKMDPVRIWRKCALTPWSICHTFPQNTINHVHNVLQFGSSLIVLTGDFANASAIWSSNLNFEKIHPVKIGSQKFRATWMCYKSNLFVYATDSQLEQNYVAVFDSLSIQSKQDLLSCKKGPRILSKYSFIFEYDLTNRTITEVFSLKKDFLPFRLFQFGSFHFPTGLMPTGVLVTYSNALKYFDGCTLV